jgi:tetrahydromethanopterin S-methyltransferase subunit A
VSLEGIEDVDDIKRAIKADLTPDLDNYPPSKLIINATKEDEDARHAVKLNGKEDLKSILMRFEVEDRPSIQKAFAERIWLFVSPVPSSK